MARTKAEAHYHVAHGYLARYKRTKAQSVRFANRTLPETSNDGPNLNPNTTTLPFDEPPSSPRITRSKALHRTSPQTQSFLLTKLPPEIRHLVWVAVVGGLEIQIIPRLHYGVALGVHHRCHCPNTQRHTCSLLRCVVDDAEAKTNLLSLLLTCRRTYVLYHVP
ncbi:hypothetical protein BJX63DRAFT_409938 [Aspergillus granulosus]|uniref:DUF7730 domain-containing protein n=1 Tax=Aspergillus granulosus TaxID=176169 RepID=A0ABR4GYD9_9EURO